MQLITLLTGCLYEPYAPSNVLGASLALDYHVDALRVLAIRSEPPFLVSGQPTTFEVFARGPDGPATRATWSTCGIAPDRNADIDGLGCFVDEVDLVALGEGLEVQWTPPLPDPDLPCDDGICLGNSQVMVRVSDGHQEALGAFWYRLWEPATTSPVTSLAAAELTLTVAEPFDGGVLLEARIEQEIPPNSVFRWYVDGGRLLDSGSTAVQRRDGGATVSTNRWELPEDPGSARAYVTLSSGLRSNGPFIEDTGVPPPPTDFGWPDEANMNWAELQLEVP